MASTELCIELASEDPRWESYDNATKAAIAIGVELSDRRGFDLDGIDGDIKNDMIDSWAEIIRTLGDLF